MVATQQYSFVRDSRKVLFKYCQTIAPDDFTRENTSYGRGGSIRNLLVHIANTYEFWIARTALKMDVNYAEYASCKEMQDVMALFENVDHFMQEFIERTVDSTRDIEYEIDGKRCTVKPIKLFTHVMTHEYHHKGQILSLSRHWGYIPVDTDIMR
ncbi:MAG: DinB family protein [Sphingobacteriaceae bacterium]